jgi:hypothetical protein
MPRTWEVDVDEEGDRTWFLILNDDIELTVWEDTERRKWRAGVAFDDMGTMLRVPRSFDTREEAQAALVKHARTWARALAQALDEVL